MRNSFMIYEREGERKERMGRRSEYFQSSTYVFNIMNAVQTNEWLKVYFER